MANEGGEWIMYGVDWDDPECLHTVEDAIAYINRMGFLPLFKNDIPGFSLEERTVADYWWSGDEEHDPWEWRRMIAARGEIAYGKFFDKKAGFITKEWFPFFANARRDGYDFDALWDDQKATIRQKKIMDLFDEGTKLFSHEVKEKAGFGKGKEKNFDGVVTGLQMQTYLCMRDFRQKKNKKGESYGWAVAIYAMPEQLWGRDAVTKEYVNHPADSAAKIKAYMKEIYPIATDKQIKKVIGV